jgi:hypothetical protein
MKTHKHPNPTKHNQDTILVMVSSNDNLQIHNGTKIKILSKLLEKRKKRKKMVRKIF